MKGEKAGQRKMTYREKRNGVSAESGRTSKSSMKQHQRTACAAFLKKKISAYQAK
jgi:hypothetical protein